jgi:hypothetical protein
LATPIGEDQAGQGALELALSQDKESENVSVARYFTVAELFEFGCQMIVSAFARRVAPLLDLPFANERAECCRQRTRSMSSLVKSPAQIGHFRRRIVSSILCLRSSSLLMPYDADKCYAD